MANLGDIKTSYDYQVLKQGPLDSRLKKKRKEDLISKDSWASNNGVVYVYPSMMVTIEDTNDVYLLKDVNKIYEEDYSGWKLIGKSSEIYVGTQQPTDEDVKIWINPEENPEKEDNDIIVDSKLSFTSTNPLQNKAIASALETGLAKKQDVLISGVNIKTINKQSLVGAGNINIDLSPYITKEKVEKNYITETVIQDTYLNKTDAEETYQPVGDYALNSELSTVAKTGDYNDLLNKPDISDTITIEVDTDMSTTSTNPVANKTIKNYIDNKLFCQFPMQRLEPYTEDGTNYFYLTDESHYNIVKFNKDHYKVAKEVRVRKGNYSDIDAYTKAYAWLQYIEIDFAEMPTDLTFTNVTWKDDVVPTFENGATYLIEVINGLATYNKFGTKTIIDFEIAGNPCTAVEGMTWKQWVDSKYNIYGFYWDGSSLRNKQWDSTAYVADAASPNKALVAGTNYVVNYGAVFPLN